MLYYFIDNAHIGMIDINKKHTTRKDKHSQNVPVTINKIYNLAPCFAHIKISQNTPI